jgi:hypothetical protein
VSQTISMLDKLRDIIAEARTNEQRMLWLLPSNDEPGRKAAWEAYVKAQELSQALTKAAERYLS